jgi:hypothetical protein
MRDAIFKQIFKSCRKKYNSKIYCAILKSTLNLYGEGINHSSGKLPSYTIDYIAEKCLPFSMSAFRPLIHQIMRDLIAYGIVEKIIVNEFEYYKLIDE